MRLTPARIVRGHCSGTLLPWLAAGVMLIGLAISLRSILAPAAIEISQTRILAGLQNRDRETLALARQHLAAYPEDTLGLALAAEAAANNSEHDLALQLFSQLPQDRGRWEFLSHMGMARRFQVLGRLEAAEYHLQCALELSPHNSEAHIRIGDLQQIEGRTWESSAHNFVQIRRGRCRGDELLALATVDRFFNSDERLERICATIKPPEVLIKLAFARTALFANRVAEAEQLLREIVASRPDLGEAQGRLGRIIVDRDDSAEFLGWVAQIPEEARNHPEVWFAKGLRARRLGLLPGAVRCFLEALALSPNHLGANMQIAGCLERLGQSEAAGEFSQRAEWLAELESGLNLVRGHLDPELYGKIVGLLGKLGRYWEAAGWSYVMTQLEFPREIPERELRHWLLLARAEATPDSPGKLPARLLNRNDYASPHWPVPLSDSSKTQANNAAATATEEAIAWNLVDDATRLGIEFQYYEGTTEETRMQHIFNTMGGGLAALDYDNDGWPDVYLAQAHNWRRTVSQPEHVDHLFRNQGGERYIDVTTLATLNEMGFSHGVTIGDVNQDGFSDLYVGNKGPNRLCLNNGDGTFTDTTDFAGVAGNQWTTSSVFADWNGDGLPDLYVLNYTLMPETAEKECHSGVGRTVACTPDLLIAEPDRCYLNLGNGQFQDISAESGIRLLDGKGLGVVAWDFGGDGRLGIFVANDTTPNFLFINGGVDPRGIPQFREEALVRGVAVDADGKAQASMGVAAGDANGDGRIDLFITTFFGESKTLFSQRADGFFEDLSRPFQLRDPGFWMLGFGSQFVDLDGDGWEDLIATNGHVDQSIGKGTPDRMPPQVFHNRGGRKFTEVPPALLGKFFQDKYLGRGLATLDWNRDGRTDFGISHLHAPFALLTNQTPSTGRPLVIRLVGRSGCREPIGATVIVKRSGAELKTLKSKDHPASADDVVGIRLYTAGDGFLVTNERCLHFAVPRDQSTVTVEVRWPGGKTEIWPKVTPNKDLLLIEGQQRAVVLREFVD
jgi:tetratricopeptide (TPR) repeat protein